MYTISVYEVTGSSTYPPRMTDQVVVEDLALALAIIEKYENTHQNCLIELTEAE